MDYRLRCWVEVEKGVAEVAARDDAVVALAQVGAAAAEIETLHLTKLSRRLQRQMMSPPKSYFVQTPIGE